MKLNFINKLIDMIAPRRCSMCGRRLAVSEDVICAVCNMKLPRTDYHLNPFENVLAQLFWGRIPIEKATALFFYHAKSETSNILYDLKYHQHPEIGGYMGRMMALEAAKNDFFLDVDAIVPVPLARKRERERGYNQSMEIAKGIASVTDLPIYNKIMKRTSFHQSQTHLGRWDRNENVESSFIIIDSKNIQGKHLLIVDDVVTTGATITACASALRKAGAGKFSVMAIGFAKK